MKKDKRRIAELEATVAKYEQHMKRQAEEAARLMQKLQEAEDTLGQIHKLVGPCPTTAVIYGGGGGGGGGAFTLGVPR